MTLPALLVAHLGHVIGVVVLVAADTGCSWVDTVIGAVVLVEVETG